MAQKAGWVWPAAAAALVLAGAACGTEDSAFSGAGGTGGSGAGAGQGGGGDGGSGNASANGGSGNTPATGGAGGEGGALPECTAAGLTPGVHSGTISFGGAEREFEVQVPAGYDNSTRVPLVFDIHGFTSDMNQQEAMSGIKAKAEAEGFVVVRPNGTGFLRSWNGGDWCCGDAQMNNLDDVGLMKAIVAQVSSELCIDPTRVYATGLSNGGALSHRIACEASDVFAAVAPVSYPLDFTPFIGCTPSRPISIIHFHGNNDVIVPYNGSANQPATPESFAYWAETNGCTGDPVETFSMGSSACLTYESCDAGVKVALCTLSGGHLLYTNDNNVDIPSIAWDFLSSFTLP
jgi:polyhydroxybutyrate depolymerase